MTSPKQVLRIATAIPALLTLALAGCGTSLNPLSSAPSGTIQPQSQPATGPVLGYVWDSSSQGLRPVQGLPGASILGAATVSASGRSAAFIATASSGISGMALFLDSNGGVFQSPLPGGALTKIASVPGANALALSNAGSYALVTGESTSGVNIASVISGLPQSPAVRNLNVSALPAIAGGAASDTGTVALAAGSGQSGCICSCFCRTGRGRAGRHGAVFRRDAIRPRQR